MKRSVTFVMLLCAMTAPTPADERFYRCTAIDVAAWQGIPDVSTNEIEVKPGQMTFTLDAAASRYQQYFDGEPIGPADEVDVQDWAGAATRGMPQVVATHPEGDFAVRIALDNDPLRFALLYPVSIVTGTCVIETESKDK